MRRILSMMVALALFLHGAVSSTFAADAPGSPVKIKSVLSDGTNILQFPNSTGDSSRPIRVVCYKPHNCPANAPIVFVMHGVHRDAERYCREWAPSAEQTAFLLVCPEFDAVRFTTAQYQQGNVLDDNKQPVPRNLWTYTTIENLFDWIKEQTGNTSSRYYMFGHSAGAQFVHRFVILMPDARYQRAVSANAGWYLMPTFSEHKYPFGLREAPFTPQELTYSFSRDFVVMLGDQDLDPNDPDLNKSPNAEEQGSNRFERGQKFFATAQQENARLGGAFNWKLQLVHGAHHSDAQMVAPALQALFGN